MAWLANLFTKYPEIAVYLAISIGFLIEQIKISGMGLGLVTGSLPSGILFFGSPYRIRQKLLHFSCFVSE